MYIKRIINIKPFFYLIIFLTLTPGLIAASDQKSEEKLSEDDLIFIIFWEGTDSVMTLDRMAALCAPVFWFSPDEPELNNKSGKDIRIPAAFPFETQVDSPVVYYQIRNILVSEEFLLRREGNPREIVHKGRVLY